MDNKPLITVAEASEYKELLALEKLPQSSQLSYKAIFKSVSSEWEQVKTDITHVNENILKDINEEIEQTDQIEKKTQIFIQIYKSALPQIIETQEKQTE